MRREPGEDVSYLELVTLPSAPFWARRHTQAALNAWWLWPETIETAELLVSELVTNALRAASCPPGQSAGSWLDDVQRICLTLRLLPRRLVIEVFDNDPQPPVLAEASADAESGRGLILVDALTKEWGYYFLPAGGKVVYGVIGLPDTAQPWHPATTPPPNQPNQEGQR